jgi:hypothetical protein
MTTQGQRKNLGTFHAKIDPTVFDAGDRGLRNAAQFGQLDLAKTLKLPNNANGLTGRNVHPLPGGAEFAHLGPPVVVWGYANDLYKQGIGNNPINHSPLLVEPGRAIALPLARKRIDGGASVAPRTQPLSRPT